MPPHKTTQNKLSPVQSRPLPPCGREAGTQEKRRGECTGGGKRELGGKQINFPRWQKEGEKGKNMQHCTITGK